MPTWVLAKLLRIDPNATLSLGFVNHSLDLDYASAIANVEHARNHGFADLATVEFYKVLVLTTRGFFDEAIARMRGAIGSGLAPNQAFALYLLADLFFATGRYREALAGRRPGAGRRGAVPDAMADPPNPDRARNGSLQEAERDLDEVWGQYGRGKEDHFPSVLAALGRSELAAAILRENDRSWREGRLAVASYSFGGHYHLGEFDQAFVWLDRAVENREWWMFPFLRSELFYSHIRRRPVPESDALLEAYRRRAGLADPIRRDPVGRLGIGPTGRARGLSARCQTNVRAAKGLERRVVRSWCRVPPRARNPDTLFGGCAAKRQGRRIGGARTAHAASIGAQDVYRSATMCGEERVCDEQSSCRDLTGLFLGDRIRRPWHTSHLVRRDAQREQHRRHTCRGNAEARLDP